MRMKIVYINENKGNIKNESNEDKKIDNGYNKNGNDKDYNDNKYRIYKCDSGASEYNPRSC